MSKKIKTKDAIKGTIKRLDRAAIVANRMRRAYIQTKDKAEHSMNAAESNPEEYASDHITAGAENITRRSVHQAKNLGQKGLRGVREKIAKGKDKPEVEVTAGEPQAEKQKRPSRQSQKNRIKTREAEAKKLENGDMPRQSVTQSRTPQTRNGSRMIGQKEQSPISVEEQSSSAVEQGRKRVIQNAQKQRAEVKTRHHSGESHLSQSADTAKKSIKESAYSTGWKPVKEAARPTDGTKTIKESVRSTGKKTIKTAEKSTAKTIKATKRAVRTAEQTSKTAIKTTKEAAKIAEKSARTAAKTAQKAAQAARTAAKATATAVKTAARAAAAAIKAIIAGTKALITAIAAGGWVAVLIIVIIMLVALIACSVFGIFFSGEDSGTGLTMPMVVQEINADYENRLEDEKSSVSYDVLEMSGSRAVWKEVLAVYAVKTNTDTDAPQEVATMDEAKKQLLSDIFWEMNEITSHTETSSETSITETDDGEGNIIETEITVTTTTLYIVVTHKTADEMAGQYNFTQEQKDYLAELLKDENNSLWAAVLYGIGYSDNQIVAVALSQLGNYGGAPYWSWYGFGSRVEWCACFVSWCANECGYIDTGVIPKYAGCVWGVRWFKERGQWTDGDAEPVPGMIIFFDWDDPDGSAGPQDGVADHTGIVERVENGVVYTVEGNSGDHVAQRQYSLGHYEILGYGVPMY